MLLSLYSVADRGLRILEFIGIVIAGVMLVIAMILMSADAFLRYFANAPLQWQYILTSSYLLPAIVCPALAWGYRTGGFIRVSATGFLPPTLNRLIIRAGLLASCAYVGVLAWKSGGYFLDVLRTGEIAITTLRWPVWGSWITVPTGLWMLCARLLLAALAPAGDLEHITEPAEEV